MQNINFRHANTNLFAAAFWPLNPFFKEGNLEEKSITTVADSGENAGKTIAIKMGKKINPLIAFLSLYGVLAIAWLLLTTTVSSSPTMFLLTHALAIVGAFTFFAPGKMLKLAALALFFAGGAAWVLAEQPIYFLLATRLALQYAAGFYLVQGLLSKDFLNLYKMQNGVSYAWWGKQTPKIYPILGGILLTLAWNAAYVTILF